VEPTIHEGDEGEEFSPVGERIGNQERNDKPPQSSI
jgi:hypothetical protein